MPELTPSFPASYADARHRWFELLDQLAIGTDRRRQFVLESKTGPHGGVLSTDTIWLGDPDAGSVLVLISATHGIEGFCGSAIQFDLLERIGHGEVSLHGQALLLVHALNPWGYAWHRRCDAEGIDLNRNFIDFDAGLPENPGFLALQDVLLDEDTARRQRAIDDYRQAYGEEACDIAVSGGQYVDANAPFYGGDHAAAGRRVIENLMASYGLGDRHLAVIDLHTGLGPYGIGEIICDHGAESAGTTTAKRWYGEQVTSPELGTSSSVIKDGLMDYAWHAIMDDRSCFVTLEFGTRPSEEVFDVLIEDHRFHARRKADQDTVSRSRLAKKMRAHFCPDADDWKRAVLSRAREVIAMAQRGLSDDN
jgi:hypothetical protein